MSYTPSDDDIVARCRGILSTHSRSFDWASRFLPADRRDDAAVVYAFCRIVDDAADEADDDAEARRRLDALHQELEGKAEPRPIVEGFKHVADRRAIEPGYARELMTGVASDLGSVQVADDRDLLRYCYRVAGTVGLMMTPLLGVDDRRGYPHAIDLGVGMQITNICRDVLEDAQNGRVYLPAERLRAAGTSQQALLEGRADRQAVARVVRELLGVAERYYASGRLGMRYIPPRSRLAIVVASRVYRAIGLKLRANGCDALAGRTIVGPLGKLREIGRALVDFLNPLRDRSPEAIDHDRTLHRPLADLPGANPPAQATPARATATAE